jgi:hypothetical protein
MRKEKYYKYIGSNGTITSGVYLLNVPHIPYVKLTAENGYVLTNGKVQLYTVTIPEDEMHLWTEKKERV